jgi:broad specificity phosphatase PhoE
MRKIYLIRHGQASWGQSNYDQLSGVGAEQCRLLGEFFWRTGVRFEASSMGGMARHAQSMSALRAGAGSDALFSPASPDVRLNEYDGFALVNAVDPEVLCMTTIGGNEGVVRRRYFRALHQALLLWTTGRLEMSGHLSYVDFINGAVTSLSELQNRLRGSHSRQGTGLLMSSGGVISALLANLLQLPSEKAVELNMQIRNSAISEIVETPRGWVLGCFNTVPHLQGGAVPPSLLTWS